MPLIVAVHCLVGTLKLLQHHAAASDIYQLRFCMQPLKHTAYNTN
jgi:hypothetical protein